MITFDNEGGLWGGFIYYPNSTVPQHVKAFVDFVDNIEKDPYASQILFTAYSPIGSAGEIVIFTSPVYTKPVERPPIYDEFLAIPGNISNALSVGISNISHLIGQIDTSAKFRCVYHTPITILLSCGIHD